MGLRADVTHELSALDTTSKAMRKFGLTVGGVFAGITALGVFQINRALDGLQAVLGGSADFDGFFEDLAGREPQLPPHLQAQLNKEDS